MSRTKTQSEKTHCPHGHPYSPENTILLKVKKDGVYNGQIKRQCRTCKKEDNRRRKRNSAKKKAEPAIAPIQP